MKCFSIFWNITGWTGNDGLRECTLSSHLIRSSKALTVLKLSSSSSSSIFTGVWPTPGLINSTKINPTTQNPGLKAERSKNSMCLQSFSRGWAQWDTTAGLKCCAASALWFKWNWTDFVENKQYVDKASEKFLKSSPDLYSVVDETRTYA